MHFAILNLREVMANLSTPDENSLVLISVDYLQAIAHQMSPHGRIGFAGHPRA
jgi:hypothetical protein